MTTPTALITGSAKRIGREIALHLADKGYDIALHHNTSKEDAERTLEDITQKGRKGAVLQANLQQAKETEKLMAAANEALGPISLLINNASVFENDEIGTMTRSSWEKHMEVNCHAPLILAQAFAKQLPEGTEGNIINMLDYTVFNPPTEQFFSYQISKSALHSATQLLAVRLAPNIRVNAIAPGATLKNPRESQAHFDKHQSESPLGISASTIDILRTINYVTSTPCLTGHTIPLDGGKWL